MSSRRPRNSFFGAALVLASLSAFTGAGTAWAVDPAIEILHRDCSTRLGRNDVTLFANGTIRWREWIDGVLTMRLAEVGEAEVTAYVHRLAGADLSEVREAPGGVAGEWVQRCELALALPGTELRTFRFGELDTHPLGLADLLRIADELGDRARESPAAGGLPANYSPQTGDLLVRADQIEFEVMGMTADKLGYELRGRIQPLSMYLTLDDLRKQFVRLIRRGPGE
ncbi:MAG: hypothetical protein ABI639_11980 [Thermoanaerobaculia bacterium]